MTAIAEKQVVLAKKTSGLAMILIDSPGKTNCLTSELTGQLEQALIEVEQDPGIKAIVIVSGKPDTFVSGADLKQIMKLTDQNMARQLACAGQAILNRLALLGKPVVAGINGLCLGGGLELALACHKRIATDDEKTYLGLPEVKLGLIPGMGGTQRLPRLIGLAHALDLIVSAEPVLPGRALEIGLVDELVQVDNLLSACQKLALQLADMPAQNWRRCRQFDESKKDRLLAAGQRAARIKTKGQYPAFNRVIEVIRCGLDKGIEAGLAMEAEVFGQLAVTDTAKNLITLAVNTELARQTGKVMSVKMKAKPVDTVAVVGSGAMGLAIARELACAGRKVLFRQTNRDKQDDPFSRLMLSIARGQSKGDERELEEIKQNVVLVPDESHLAQADLIIEAIFEDDAMKMSLFNSLEKIVAADCIIASNTSSLSINKLGSAFLEPGRFLGMHFFLPVERMPAVEVISHKSTRREAIARAAGLVAALGKIPVIVNDGPGFLVNRLLCTYIIEAARLAEAGTPLNWIDEAALEFGMAMGPFVVLDEVGLDVAFKVAESLCSGLGSRYSLPSLIEKTKALGLKGKKTGSGIYTWDAGGRRLEFNPCLISNLGLVVDSNKVSPESSAWIGQRLILPMIDEAARVLEDKIVRKPREIDLSMVLGTGFPAFRGGPLKYADALGIGQVKEKLQEIYREDGTARRVSNMLQEMEAQRRCFYSRCLDEEDKVVSRQGQ